ncbi:DKNYY domain-containing protein [Chryseobacterium luteum]|uniref:Lipoprotein n=1 Tax=Chryseobacterium luteum TaxID=421531 RepID=A0A085Z0C2_9FLAO|nr:DKNYY domain-containing protein [Chryseobacterium luteum]KFE97885.1 hypothetical protein IX38_19670 [Chryseobacterium luteum]
MKKIITFSIVFLLISCSEKKETHKIRPLQEKPENTPNQSYQTNPAEYDLKDSTKLIPIKNDFYKNEHGFLYHRTFAQREFNGHLEEAEYFNGVIPQEIDPNTFQQIENSLFAKDHKNIYYFHPTSGGIQISKIESTDVKTFQILKGNYKYAVDKNNFYKEADKIEKFIPLKTEQIKDSKGKVIKLKMANKEISLEK